MPDPPKKLGRHVFLSYQRAERSCAKELFRRMRHAGLAVWLDDEAIEPGIPDWEAAIRDGVNDAFAIVLVASPLPAESQYVQSELKLAQKLGRPIVPVWAKGDDWVDCAPLALVNTQYVDCRGDQFDGGVERLVVQLKKIVTRGLPKILAVATLNECPLGFTPILMEKNDGDKLDLKTASQVAETTGKPFPSSRTFYFEMEGTPARSAYSVCHHPDG